MRLDDDVDKPPRKGKGVVHAENAPPHQPLNSHFSPHYRLFILALADGGHEGSLGRIMDP